MVVNVSTREHVDDHHISKLDNSKKRKISRADREGKSNRSLVGTFKGKVEANKNYPDDVYRTMSQDQKDQVQTLREKFHPKDTRKQNTAALKKQPKQLEEEASDDNAVDAASSTKKLKVIINIDDDEDNSKADDGTSLENEPMEPMRAPIKSKTVAKKDLIAKATAAKATKLKVTKPEEPAAKSAKGGRAGTQFGRSPIFIR